MAKTRDAVFEEILFEIGNHGRFQKTYNYLYNFLFNFLATVLSMSILMLLAEPEHWCHVPGNEMGNYSAETWKQITIPMKNDSETPSFEQCKMYYDGNITECKFGNEYNTTWYTNTITSQQDWVCKEQYNNANALTAGKVGEILGSFVFGQLGDKYGRLMTFYLSLMSLLAGRILAVFSVNMPFVFFFAIVVSNLSSLSLYQAPLIITMEISRDEDRAHASLVQAFSWTIGMCATPLMYWLISRWFIFSWITIIPLLAFLIPTKYLIESPRWLANKGHVKKCIETLRKIAKVNKTTISPSQIERLEQLNEIQEQKSNLPGFIALFQSESMVKVTILNMIGWSTYLMLYTILMLNATNLGGNPFMNFFWLSLAEMPGYFIGKYMSDYFGRRLSRISSSLVSGLCTLWIAFIITDPKQTVVVVVVSIIVKLLISITYYAMNLQCLEIYPTFLRQTGTSVGITTGFLFGLGIPYVIYMGNNLHPSIPYVLATITAILGAAASLFLPETLYKKLPETLQDVDEFMKSARFWQMMPKKYNKCEDKPEKA